MKPVNDQFLINAIMDGGAKRQQAIRTIYDDSVLKSKVINFVRNHGGNTEDGQDIFHEGIIALDRNVREKKFREETSLQGYLFSICRFAWMNRARKQAKTTLVDESKFFDGKDEVTPELTFENKERNELLESILGNLGDRCRKILEMWKLSYSMSEIASEMGLANDVQARKAKYRCHNSLIKFLSEHPEINELLKNYYKK